MANQPKKLTRDPIVEALFQVRFTPSGPSVGDLLPGMLFSKQKGAQLERLDSAMLPRELQKIDPNLKYEARYRFQTDKYVTLLGDNSVTLSCLRPYVGWESFKPRISALIDDLAQTGLIQTVERFSLKFVNMLEADTVERQNAFVHWSGTIGKFRLDDLQVQFRTEIFDDGFSSIVDFANNAAMRTIRHAEFKGLLLSIDTISKNATNFFEQYDTLLDQAHNVEKSIFFSILSDHGKEQFGAEY